MSHETTVREFLNTHKSKPFQWGIVFIALLALAWDGLDIQLLSLVSPAIIEEWGVSKSEFGPALAAALVGMSFGASIGGWLGDRYGRKLILVTATFGFGIATVLASYTNGILAMVILRLISGLGFGAAGPNGIALATEWMPERMRPRVVALLSIGVPLGGLMGSVIVMQLLPSVGWKGAFIICGGLTVVLAVAMLFFLIESPSYHLAKGFRERAVKSLSKVAVFTPPTVEQTELGDTQRKNSNTTIFTRDNTRINIGASLAFFSTSFVGYAVITWAPVLLTMVGFTIEEALRGSVAYNFASVITAVLTSVLINRFGTKKLIVFCGFANLTCLSVMAFLLGAGGVEYTTLSKLLIVSMIGACGAFSGAIFAALYSLLAYAYETECRSGGIGFGMMVGRFGGIATILSGGFLLQIKGNNPLPFMLVLLLGTLVIVVSAYVVDRHIPKFSEQAK